MKPGENYRMLRLIFGLSFPLLVAGCAASHTYYCDDSCGPQAFSGRHGNCGGAACETCEGTGVGPVCGQSLTATLGKMMTCNSGCGRYYWGEWCYDPPDQCDPCGNHGDYVGQRCCPPGVWSRLWQGLHGARYCEGTCGASCGPEASCGCDTCGGEDPAVMEPWQEGVIESIDEIEVSEPTEAVPMEPTAARQPSRAPRSYYSRDPNSRLVRRPAP